MKRINVILVILAVIGFLSIINADAQQQDWNWYFGNNAALNFSSGNPTSVSGSALATQEGSASISDAIGNLLFYTDGSSVWDRNNNYMPSAIGTLLGDGSSTQSGVIVQKPGSSTLYYIFTADQGGYGGPNQGINYSIVDMTLNAGNGDVSTLNSPILVPSVEKITAVRHCNGVDVWIIIHGWLDNNFYAYLLTSTGLSATPVTSAVGSVYVNTSGFYNETIGYMKVSPNGRKVGCAVYYEMNIAEVFDFDNSSGVLSNAITINLGPPQNTSDGPYGLAFSPNSQVMYVGYYNNVPNSIIYQYDISSNVQSTVIASQYPIPVTDATLGALQLAVNGKIYVSEYGLTHLNAINNPDVLGIGCNYTQNAVALTTGTCSYGLPNFVDAFTSPPPATSEHINIVSCNDTLTLSPTGTGTSYLWSNGATTATLFVNDTPGVYWVHVIGATACTQVVNIADTFNVTFAMPPVVNLGPDHSLCSPATDTLRAGNPGDTYLWSTGATTQNIHINTTGTYWVQVNNGGCTGSDTVTVTFVTNPTVNLGPDTTICSNATLTLDAGNTGFNFLWNTGATTETITVNTAGTYSVFVSQNLCHARDTIIISIANPPIVNIGPDTTICSNQTITLNAGNTGSTFIWSTGATIQTITPTATGVYWVRVNHGGCAASDTASVTVIQMPVVNLGLDDTICIGNTITLDANNAGYNFLWSTGATTETIDVTSAGTYSVFVNMGLCFRRDTINITTIFPPTVNIGHDTVVCSPHPVILNAGNAGNTYLWSTGQATQGITVTNPGIYWVIVNNGSCTRADSMIISVVTPPVLATLFHADTTQGCNPLTITLTNGSSGGTSYLWRFGDGQTSALFNPNHQFTVAGSYTITLIVMNDTSTVCGDYIDSLVINQYIAVADPVVVTSGFTGSPIKGCSPLTVDFLNTSVNGTAYYWSFGNTFASTDANPANIVYTAAGTYKITLIASSPNAHCYNPPDTMSIEIVADSCQLYIPNVFSPNGDGKNEFFHVIGEGYANYHLLIFNRWGEKLFESDSKLDLWNGQVNNTGRLAPDGTYYYIFTAIDPDNKPFADHGFLTLIR